MDVPLIVIWNVFDHVANPMAVEFVDKLKFIGIETLPSVFTKNLPWMACSEGELTFGVNLTNGSTTAALTKLSSVPKI